MFSGTKYLSFVKIPVFLEIVFEIASIWLHRYDVFFEDSQLFVW